MMYPVFLDLKGRACLVVGGGKIALRKVLALLRSEAVITVISKEYHRNFKKISHRISFIERPFEESDIHPGLSVVIGATNVMEVNRKISKLAQKYTIPCNIVDKPALCSFIVPAVVRRDPVTIAVSTGGAAPRLAKYCKTIAANAFSSSIPPLANYLAGIRKRLFVELPDGSVRAVFWEELFAVDPLETIEKLGWDAYRQRTDDLIVHFSKRIVNNEKN